MKYYSIRIKPFGYEIVVSSRKLAAFYKRIMTQESFEKLGIKMNEDTFREMTGMHVSDPFTNQDHD